MYELNAVICTVGGVAINGYGTSEDAIAFEWDADLVELQKSADGRTLYSRIRDRGCVVTIMLAQSSLAYRLLASLLEQQHGDSAGAAPANVPPMPFFLRDPATGDEVSGEAVFLNRPAPNKGKTLGEVEFRLHLDNPKTTYGANNVV